MTGASYRDLIIWRKSIRLVAECYELCKRLPATEEYGLKSQIRRAAVSIAANIAEGHGRRHPKEFARFLSIARGSVKELETLLIICCVLGLLTKPDVEAALSLCDEISRMASTLQHSIRSRASSLPTPLS
jgi:four helix bundle protein